VNGFSRLHILFNNATTATDNASLNNILIANGIKTRNSLFVSVDATGNHCKLYILYLFMCDNTVSRAGLLTIRKL
jgi:hypothetical protein